MLRLYISPPRRTKSLLQKQLTHTFLTHKFSIITETERKVQTEASSNLKFKHSFSTDFFCFFCFSSLSSREQINLFPFSVMRCCCSLPAGLQERKRTVKNWRCCCSSLPARLEEQKWTVRNWRPKEIRERERTQQAGKKKLLHVSRVFRQSKMVEKRWQGMRRRLRGFNYQSLPLRNYIIFTAKRSRSLPQLSHNSRTSLYFFWVSPPRRIRISIRIVQLRYDGDKHVRTYMFPLVCTYYYNVPRLVQFSIF